MTSTALFPEAGELIASHTFFRPYQIAAIETADEMFGVFRSVLIVMATGTGKTEVFTEIARRRLHRIGKRIMVVVHLDTLAKQTIRKIRKRIGIDPEVEKAESWAGDGPIVVASRQSLNSAWTTGRKRVERFDPFAFDLIIFDEAHRSTSATNQLIINHFRQNPDCKILGTTATPDRGDGVRLVPDPFEAVAPPYNLPEAIRDGYLVDVKQLVIENDAVQYGDIDTVASDLNEGQLEELMSREAVIHPMIAASIEIACGLEIGALLALKDIADLDERARQLEVMLDGKRRRKSLVFTVTVALAERIREIFCRWIPNCARVVVGTTSEEERELTFREYHEGKFQFLVGVGVMTEGFDEPDIEVLIQGRPTKKRALAAQMIGRTTRPCEAIADQLGQLHTADERRALIASSSKPHALVVDFVGNAGRHKLIYCADVLCGPEKSDVAELAMEIAATSDITISEAIEQAECDIEEECAVERLQSKVAGEALDRMDEQRLIEETSRACLVGAAKYQTTEVNGFDPYSSSHGTATAMPRGGSSDKQINILVGFGFSKEKAASFGGQQASAIISKKMREGCVTWQADALRKGGYFPAEIEGINYHEAQEIIAQISANRGRRLGVE